jgi:hypothetical protein
MKPPDPAAAARFQQVLRPDHIRRQKHAGPLNRPVHMGFGGKIDDSVKPLSFEQAAKRILIRNICFVKPCFHAESGHRFGIPRIGERIGADELILRMNALHIENKIAPDKTGAAGDE